MCRERLVPGSCWRLTNPEDDAFRYLIYVTHVDERYRHYRLIDDRNRLLDDLRIETKQTGITWDLFRVVETDAYEWCIARIS